MTVEAVAASSRANLFRRLWPVLKLVLFALVVVFVGQRAWNLWREGDVGAVTIHWWWLLAAGVLYLIGWLPSVLLWHRLIHVLGGTSNRFDVARAYFAGHLAKYIPGKASVLIVRAGMLADRGCRPSISALTSTYEVLVAMGVGLAVGITMAPVVWPKTVIDRLPTAIHPAFGHPLIFGIGVVVVCVALVPFVAQVLGLIARKLTPPVTMSPGQLVAPSDSATTDSPPTQIGGRFLLGWCFFSVTTWLVHGLSLGCTLRAVGVEASMSDLLIWTGDVASASFLGFAAMFAPGGLGVREAALLELLMSQPGINPAQAAAATMLLRAAWLVAEILAAAALTWRGFRKRTRSVSEGDRFR
ncbi:MAG: flippase-like domain-containing protein [Planctomycetes bacterium]|nr:flippase-like domain-containing protein [Planctomycetota bacterium]